MVLAAPLFMIAQTKSLREFYVANKPGFALMGLGVLSCYLSMRMLGKVVSAQTGTGASGQ